MKKYIKNFFSGADTGEEKIHFDRRWVKVKDKLKKSKRIIDLGCGNNPVTGASVGVDLYIDPKEREDGGGDLIDAKQMEQKGIKFVNARVDSVLPFEENEFDFAYSHHVFEHLDDPALACREMMRIADSGVIITPSFFSECIFGRPYHQWLIMEREQKLYFFKKRPFENIPFGEQPKKNRDTGRYGLADNTNPFDMLLNDNEWYCGEEGNMPKLTKMLRQYWYSHSRLTEVIFHWDKNFQWEIID